MSTKKNKSDVNISVFTETPHGLSKDNTVILDHIRKQSQLGFKIQTGIPDDWEGKTVIEFGCGAGMKILPYALKGATIVGVDGSASQLKRIEKNAKELGVNGKFLHEKLEDVEAGSLPKADLVICSAVIHHVHDWKKLINIISKVLKENGYFYLTWCDWTTHVSGFNIKNQIAYRLGWNNASRLVIGKFLFGWWDKKRNVMGLEDKSFYADLYSAYYIPISCRKMLRHLNINGFEVLNALLPHNINHYIKYHDYAKSTSRFLQLFRRFKTTPIALVLNAMLRLRHYTIPKHGPRIISAKKL